MVDSDVGLDGSTKLIVGVLSDSTGGTENEDSSSDKGNGTLASSIILGIVGTSDGVYKLAASSSISFEAYSLMLGERDSVEISSAMLGSEGMQRHSAVSYSVEGGVEGHISAVV